MDDCGGSMLLQEGEEEKLRETGKAAKQALEAAQAELAEEQGERTHRELRRGVMCRYCCCCGRSGGGRGVVCLGLTR